MSHTHDAIGALGAALAALPRNVALPMPSASQKLVEALGAAGAPPALPARAVLEVLRSRLANAFASGRRGELTRRDFQDVPWVMWNGSPAGAGVLGLLDEIVKQGLESSRTTRNVIEAWLRDFSPHAPDMNAAGQAIQRLLLARPDRRLDLWRAAQRRFQLFDARNGPRTLAEALINSKDTVADVISAAGFDDPLRASGGYMRATIDALLSEVPAVQRRQNGGPVMERVLDVIAPEHALRFGTELRGEIGKALLNAWVDRGPEPDATQCDLTRGFLLRHLLDPRLRASNWTAVGEVHTAVMRRWLARASLKAFFALIADHAWDVHWRYREAFWSACLEKGGIDDAWLVLGSRVLASARAIRDLAGAYGELGGAGGDQSVLLLRVGPLIMCEWSHNGKLRAWKTDWKNAPKMGSAAYRRTGFMTKGVPFPVDPGSGRSGNASGDGLIHNGSEPGYWQGSAAELIKRHTGIVITRQNWRPR